MEWDIHHLGDRYFSLCSCIHKTEQLDLKCSNCALKLWSQRKRKRKIIWFNPPFSKSIKTNINKIFLQLLSKYFPKNHKMHKILNRNSVKISYNCMKSIGSIISAHNWNILNPIVQYYGCNCKVKSTCPLNDECFIPKIIYRPNVSND